MLSFSRMDPVVYSPDGTRTVSPPPAAHLSTAACMARVAESVLTPIAPKSRTLQTSAHTGEADSIIRKNRVRIAFTGILCLPLSGKGILASAEATAPGGAT